MPRLCVNSWGTQVWKVPMSSHILVKGKGKSGWMTSTVQETKQILPSVCIMAGAVTTALTAKTLGSFVIKVSVQDTLAWLDCEQSSFSHGSLLQTE